MTKDEEEILRSQMSYVCDHLRQATTSVCCIITCSGQNDNYKYTATAYDHEEFKYPSPDKSKIAASLITSQVRALQDLLDKVSHLKITLTDTKTGQIINPEEVWKEQWKEHVEKNKTN